MCGICGIAYVDPSRPVESDRIVRMRNALAHRGPDGSGIHCQAGVSLGHRRLSIIDLQNGAQPLANEDETIWVTFNGEIYNYQELTERLVGMGHRFRTRCDSEVLVHAYEEYGQDVAIHLRGMFAFGVHDVRGRRVLLVRDHFGIKPLFYTVTTEGLFFASEIKAILAVLDSTPTVDLEALQEYLTFRYVACSRTLFDGIRRLPPGHIAVWEDSRLSVRQYWSAANRPIEATASAADSVNALDGLLECAVRSQLMSDVPIGAFCSGGVDSGLVSSYAAGNTSGPLHTFSVGFDEPAWDETRLATDTAARLGTQHHTLRARAHDFQKLLCHLIWYNDEPLSHPNSVHIYLLSEFARQYVTVVLTGEGADELFCGYPRYHLARLTGSVRHLPRWTTTAAAQVVGALPGHRATLAGRLLRRSFEDSVLFNSAYVDPDLVAALTRRPVASAIAERRTLLRESMVPGDAIASISRYELQTYLGCALERMDRMSMASGLEGRVPFLDVPLVEWGLALPSSLKMRGYSTKHVVKQLAKRILSSKVTRGRKSGFGVPLRSWFRGRAFAPLVARLRDPRHPAATHFDRPILESLVAAHLSGSADWSEVLWLVSNVYLWYEVCLNRERPTFDAAELSGFSSPARGALGSV